MTQPKTSNAKTTDHTAKSAKPQPWEQQPQESDLHYSYFNTYKDIPTPTRTVKKATEILNNNGKMIGHDHLLNISAKYKWQDRVSAWDKHMSQLTISSKEMNVQRMNDKHFNVGKECIDSLMGDLNDPELLNVPVDKRAYVKQALIRGMEGAVRIQRLALGESTSNTRQVNEGINNLMMVLTDSKKQLQKQQKKKNDDDVIDVEAEVIRTTK
jgi:hypothetical protein